jgi:HK97 family phage prohead protease
MKLEIRNDKVVIEGYVNAIERNSKPLMSRIGQFIERICKGAFKKAIGRSEDIKILLNHDWNRVLGSTKEGNLELHEDNIGLHARAEITDADVIEKAKRNDLVGWSFGFSDRDVINSIEKGMPIREVKDLDLFEVSILDRTKTPAYDGTLIEARDDGQVMQFRGEDREAEVTLVDNSEPSEQVVEQTEPQTEPQIEEEPKQQEIVENNTPLVEQEEVDYSTYENDISKMKGD